MIDSEERAQETAKRTNELKIILDTYIENFNLTSDVKLKLKFGYEEKLCNTYFDLLNSTIKVYLNPGSYASIYKVASGTEIACMAVLPIDVEGQPELNVIKQMNALFASFAAISILTPLTKLTEFKPEASLELFSIWKNHIKWLVGLNRNINNSPTYSNSIFWEAFMLAYKLSSK